MQRCFIIGQHGARKGMARTNLIQWGKKKTKERRFVFIWFVSIAVELLAIINQFLLINKFVC